MLTIEKLTDREKEVLELIKEDATISREEIAKLLGISESAVGTYIHHLSNKGYLLGRGYITAPEKKVVVVGGANLDIKGYTKNYIKGSSSPGWIKESPGGVGRNIAEDLALLGEDVVLLTAVSNDHFGQKLKEETAAAGVDISHFKISSKDKKTGTYLAHLDQNGELIGAVNDMGILREINCDYLTEKRKIIETSTMLIFDTNLEKKTISCLLDLSKDKKMIKIADTVSVEKALKLRGKLKNLDYLRTNIDEIEALFGISAPKKEEENRNPSLKERINKVAQIYAEKLNLPEMIISTGKDGAYYLSKKNEELQLEHFGAENIKKIEVVETTGAGDALTAGLAAGIINKETLSNSIKLGIKAAALTVRSELTCNPDIAELK